MVKKLDPCFFERLLNETPFVGRVTKSAPDSTSQRCGSWALKGQPQGRSSQSQGGRSVTVAAQLQVDPPACWPDHLDRMATVLLRLSRCLRVVDTTDASGRSRYGSARMGPRPHQQVGGSDEGGKRRILNPWVAVTFAARRRSLQPCTSWQRRTNLRRTGPWNQTDWTIFPAAAAFDEVRQHALSRRPSDWSVRGFRLPRRRYRASQDRACRIPHQ